MYCNYANPQDFDTAVIFLKVVFLLLKKNPQNFCSQTENSFLDAGVLNSFKHYEMAALW